MNNKQIWTTIVLTFVLLMTVTIGVFGYGTVSEVSKILQAPAATSELDVDADMMFEMSKDGELQLTSIHLNRIRGSVNSKILDLILLLKDR